MNTVTQSPTNDFSNLSEVLWDACKKCPGQMILDKKATRDWGRPVYRCLQCGYQDTDRAPTEIEMEETQEANSNNDRDFKKRYLDAFEVSVSDRTIRNYFKEKRDEDAINA